MESGARRGGTILIAEIITEIKAFLPTLARYIMVGMLGWNFFENVLRHGESKPEEKYNGFRALFALWFTVALLNMGGFWG